MSNEEDVLQEYSNSINNLRRQCSDAGMSDDEFRKMYFQSLKNLSPKEHEIRPRRCIITKCRMLLLVVIIGCYVMYNYKTIYSTIMCNVQEYIYPGLKVLRQISIPIISLFPSLTDFYHETCLIQNPFFTVVDMDCWPCSAVTNVMEINPPQPGTQQHTAPFIYETDQEPLNITALKEMYIKSRDTFIRESPKILVNSKYYTTPDDLFDNNISDDRNFYTCSKFGAILVNSLKVRVHSRVNAWINSAIVLSIPILLSYKVDEAIQPSNISPQTKRFNNIKVAHLLRQVIPRPKVVPKFGQSTERFIIVDRSQGSFRVPDTECSFSFLLALSGTREIYLLPAEECKHQCKTLKVRLKETYLLWYNWWYWRPVVQLSMGNETFIAHVGSYC